VFVKERIHNAVEIDILGIFGLVFIVTNLLPTEKLFRGCGLATSPNFKGNSPGNGVGGLANTHVETENSSIVQIEAPSTRIRIFSNPQLFRCGYGYRPHVYGEFDSESVKK